MKESTTLPGLDDLRRNIVLNRSLATSQRVNCIADFIEGWWGVEFLDGREGNNSFYGNLAHVFSGVKLLEVFCPILHLFSAVNVTSFVF